MKRVLKYVLSPDCVIQMPKKSKILAVHAQHDIPCVWVLCDDENEKEERRFMIYGTGHKIEADLDLGYIGTFQLACGNLVFHVFEDHDFPYQLQEKK